ncbi:MAG: hypothetical protein F6K48_32335 [Okeania sp. SIO3H1]|uniref:hypothetical protein n=1 Tax=Okeania sp. SIO1I7 TaxID=2607772 RepID=UPI0013CD08A2|nr:hypothetical protein [Okeania sp. SIO1I7]NEN93321.1 hypothetical protein [Okeania sp. SIO3H1]NET30208.1 hypothetical protein [Okeania sp. SIO1I7]
MNKVKSVHSEIKTSYLDEINKWCISLLEKGLIDYCRLKIPKDKSQASIALSDFYLELFSRQNVPFKVAMPHNKNINIMVEFGPPAICKAGVLYKSKPLKFSSFEFKEDFFSFYKRIKS